MPFLVQELAFAVHLAELPVADIGVSNLVSVFGVGLELRPAEVPVAVELAISYVAAVF